MTLLSKASLVATPTAYGDGVLNSVKPTDGDGDFDFARASSATRVNEEGLIEKERENLLIQSNSFDISWTNYNTTETGGQVGYDGSSDAWLLEKTGASGSIYQSIYPINGVRTFSVYVKAGTRDWCRLTFLAVASAYFDLANGVVGSHSGIDSDINSIGGGWYRCSFSVNASGGTGVSIIPAESDGVISGTSGNIYIQDAQLEQGLVATDYIETTTSSVAVGITNDIPRINYEGGIGNFLLEPQRTNVVVNSEYFNVYPQTRITLTNNAIVSPDGGQNATKIVETTDTGLHFLAINGSVTSSANAAFSIFAKQGENQFLQVLFGTAQTSPDAYANIDLSNGTYNDYNMVSFDTEDYGNGWYRIFGVVNSLVTSLGFYIASVQSKTSARAETYTGDGTSGFYLWGSQMESSVSYPTSYIPTYGSAVTRAAETCNNAGNSDLFNDSEGVLYAEIAALDDDGTTRRISLSDGTTNNRIVFSYSSTSNQFQTFLANPAVQFNFYHTLSDSTDFNKIAVKYKLNDFALWINGVEVATDVSGTLPVGLDRINFDEGSGASDFYGKTKMVSTFTEALSDSELECLTSWSSFERMATAQNYTIE